VDGGSAREGVLRRQAVGYRTAGAAGHAGRPCHDEAARRFLRARRRCGRRM